MDHGSRGSGRSTRSHSRGSRGRSSRSTSTQSSGVVKLNAMATLRRRKVELKYATVEAHRNLELAQADVDAIEEVEEGERARQLMEFRELEESARMTEDYVLSLPLLDTDERNMDVRVIQGHVSKDSKPEIGLSPNVGGVTQGHINKDSKLEAGLTPTVDEVIQGHSKNCVTSDNVTPEITPYVCKNTSTPFNPFVPCFEPAARDLSTVKVTQGRVEDPSRDRVEPEMTQYVRENTSTPMNPFVPCYETSAGLSSVKVVQGQDSYSPCVYKESSNNPFQPKTEAFGDNHDNPSATDYGIADAIRMGMEAGRLPTPTLQAFDGKALDWPTWRTAFETVIERRTANPGERILYLMQFLTGEPRKIIEGYQFLQTNEAYQEAKKKLEERFGHPSVVADAFREKLDGWKKIQPKDGVALREYADFLGMCELAMKSIDNLQTLNNEHENKRLLKPLPSWTYPKWGSKVKDFQTRHGKAKFPPFSEFVRFLNDQAELQCLPVLAGLDYGRAPREAPGSRPKPQERRTLETGVQEKPIERPKDEKQGDACLFCRGSHGLDCCKGLTEKPMKERIKFIMKKGLCLRCLEHGHMAKQNKCKINLICKRCKERHPTCLHRDNDKKEESNDKSTNSGDVIANCATVCSIEGQKEGTDQSLIVPVWISQGENPLKEILTYALLDSQSNATFITDGLCKELSARGIESDLLLSTMHEENEAVKCKKIKELRISDSNRNVIIKIDKAFTRGSIPCKVSQIPKPEVAAQWEHLKGIADKIMPYRDDIQVGILVGTNCLRSIKPRDVIPGENDEPYGIRTDLGWRIVGRVCQSPHDNDDTEIGTCANRIVTHEVGSANCPGSDFVYETCAKEAFTPSQVRDMFEQDFHEVQRDEKPMSVEDRIFMVMMDSGIHKRDDGHYEMPLPLRTGVRLPNNRPLALKRLMHLKNRFVKDKDYHREYTTYMDSMIENCAEEVQMDDDTREKPGRINYAAHHGVEARNKSLRVVFDCSARYEGTSLNKNVIQGPDLTNNLTGVLCRFREGHVAFACDIKGMYNQFYVNEEDRDLLRFLWFKNGDVDADPTEYRMKVHVFGAASSPGCANYALKKAAEDGEEEFGTEAAAFVKRDFYVDDGLASVSNETEAIELIKNCGQMCSKAGLKLHKFVSNSKKVIEAVPAEDRAKGLQSIDLEHDPLPIERTLGIVWCIELDCFQFRIAIQDRPLTRRGILGTVSSVYDPLGLAAPVILRGKQILQELCRSQVGWDDPIPEELKPRWEQWRRELSTLEELQVRRCYKPEDFGELQSVELHHFSDASQSGYGQCSYIRLKDTEDRVSCALVMAKARVAPVKQVSIPRLELTAAVVSARVSAWLRRELTYNNIVEHFWTDSRVVLGYINNSAKRFHVYVANRVQEIHDCTKPSQWHYVESSENPADEASRGLRARQLIDSPRWLSGPEFLRSAEVKLADDASKLEPDLDDPEVRRAVVLVAQTTEAFPSHFEVSRLDRFSEWRQAKTAIALCLQLKSRLRKSDKSGDEHSGCKIGVEEMNEAETEILKCLQHEHFSEEIELLSDDDGNASMKKKSKLYRLDPYLDEKGMLRVGGRLRNAVMDEVVKHPVVLPRKSHVSELIIRHCHEETKHQGLGMTHNELRQSGYWVIGGISAVSRYITNCVTCKKLRAKAQEQKMADLPSDRTEPAPPFTYSAVDYFGPFTIKEKRTQLKRWGVVFTCMSSRAVHVETSNSLETDAFINVLRRFEAERGPVRQLRSDRGTNFVGASNELKEEIKEMDQERIRSHLMKRNCEWIEFAMNPPRASHMGGIWERQIRTIRSILAGLLKETGDQLDDESFRTLMKEVQSIINSRPLSVSDTASPDCPDPLTPNHLLTMKTKVLLPPPGVFVREDLYLRRRWRRVQHLANCFWDRWRKEYLQNLQCRSKWTRPRRNMQVDDVVLMLDDDLPRNKWKLGKVCETYPSKDGLVRKVKVQQAADLDSKGRRLGDLRCFDRPVQKLVLLKPRDQGIPDEEP